ncbi:MAG TPA: MFS transporter [Steroidobacteraceae bacterium]|jgi:fucose permease|nr:MFS transporter [Steroidobacteraceae bacterium]
MRNRALIIGYILCVWFVISFVTNIIGPLMPIIIREFGLSLGLAGFLPFSFFLAYGVISIPAGMMVERFGARAILLGAFALNLLGSAAIAWLPSYLVVIGGLFVIGLGMAMLQVVINPLTRTAGGEAHFAFFSVMGQLVFGAASFVSPLAFAALMERGNEAPWVTFYGAFAAVFAFVIIVTRALPLPSVELKDDERAGTRQLYWQLLSDRQVRLFFLGIVAYVGTEQSLANWMSQFLSTYHGLSPTVEGAHAVAMFWGLMSVGCLLGLLLLRLLDSRVVLAMFSVAAIVCIALALFGPARVAVQAFPAAGFFLSVMFSIVFSLALNSVPRHHGAFSGILCTGILGGALVPLLVGVLGDWLGLRAALTVLFATVGYVLSVSFWARPLIRNETVTLRRLLPAPERPPPS